MSYKKLMCMGSRPMHSFPKECTPLYEQGRNFQRASDAVKKTAFVSVLAAIRRVIGASKINVLAAIRRATPALCQRWHAHILSRPF